MAAGRAGALSPVAVAVWAPSLAALTLLPALLGAVGVGYYLWRGLSARRMFEQALRHYAQVTYDYEATELHARLIPEGETRGAHVMAHYHWFRDEYANLARSWQDFGSPRGIQWFGLSMLRRATDLRRRSAALDTLDDVVANTATFLNQDRGWEQAWYNEQGPLLEDLQALLTLCQKIDSSGRLPVNTMGTREKVRWFHERLGRMTMDLSAGRLQPSQALDELDLIAIDPEDELVFVEVKTRSSEDFGHPFASIDRDKARRTRLLAILWCRLRENLDFPRFRIDAIGVTGTCETFTFEHLKAVA